jgi:hypothetical protein
MQIMTHNDPVRTFIIRLIDWSRRWEWAYVSEPRPKTGLLFIPKVIQEHAASPRQDDASRVKLPTRPPELSGNPTSIVVWEQVGGMDERSENFAL